MLHACLRILHMSSLRIYLDTLETGGVSDFARRVGISPVYLSQIASGVRELRAAKCVEIEEATRGHVQAWELRSDGPQIWRPSAYRRQPPQADAQTDAGEQAE